VASGSGSGSKQQNTRLETKKHSSYLLPDSSRPDDLVSKWSHASSADVDADTGTSKTARVCMKGAKNDAELETKKKKREARATAHYALGTRHERPRCLDPNNEDGLENSWQHSMKAALSNCTTCYMVPRKRQSGK
jgi:hypothetical protein